MYQADLCLIHGSAFYFWRRLTAVTGCMLFLLTCFGCGTLRVHQMQKRAAQGDDAWIAAQAVGCNNASQSCSQLHFIKGKACLRLAERGKEPATHYACASDELARGIALKPAWDDLDEQLNVVERYCDALDGLQRLHSGSTANKIRNRLLDAAQTMYRLAPDSVPAIYYMSIAWLRQLEPRISTINAANRVPVCSRLKRTVNQVLSLMETARQEHLPEWRRFERRYQRLAFDLGAAMHTAECR